MSGKRQTLTIRLDPAMRDRIDKAREANPFKPTITAIVERGITLAIDELENQSAAWSKGGDR